MNRLAYALASFGCALFFVPGLAGADDAANAPRPVPLTRPEMKGMLEDMKGRTPRIPLPELTAEEKAKEAADPRAFGYEGRLRSLYLPDGDMRVSLNFSGSPRGGFGSGNNRVQVEQDPALTLDYKFKTQLFWIASRANNCQYCLGHQESKLLSAGMLEDEIAALDADWSNFKPAEQAAFALARRLTLEPHLLSDADIDRCREFYTGPQIIEMVMSVAGNNSINRWKEGTGVPQSANGGNFGRGQQAAQTSESHGYLTPTSDKFQKAKTVVAPVVLTDLANSSYGATVCDRPALEPMSEVLTRLEAARQREPRLPLVDEDKAREILGESAPEGAIPQWMRLLANFPIAGQRTVASIRSSEDKGDLSPLLKAQMSWVVARQDRAWYAMGDAYGRLKSLGQTDEQIAALDGDQQTLEAKDQALLTFAKNLAASPVVLTDEQAAEAVKLAGPRDVVQTITYTTFRAAFDRFTEAAGLTVDK